MASIPELELWCRGTDLEPLSVYRHLKPNRSGFVSCWLHQKDQHLLTAWCWIFFFGCLFLLQTLIRKSWIDKKSKFTVEFSQLIKRWAPLKRSEKQKETWRAAEGPSRPANDKRCWWLFYDITTKSHHCNRVLTIWWIFLYKPQSPILWEYKKLSKYLCNDRIIFIFHR